MKNELTQIINQIEPLDPSWLAQAQARLDSLTKPRGSLGRLERVESTGPYIFGVANKRYKY